MDRLTIRLKDGHAGVLGHTPDWAVADRLADYEDTGLEPEEIRAIQKKIDDVHRLVKLIDPKKLEHLSYLVDAEEQGRLIVLPEKMTNADRIRAMSDEELAGFIAPTEEYGPAPWCKPIGRDRCGRPSCHSCALAYLRQPAEGGKQDGAD